MRRAARLLGAGLVIGALALLLYLVALVFEGSGDEALPRRLLEPLLTVMSDQQPSSRHGS